MKLYNDIGFLADLDTNLYPIIIKLQNEYFEKEYDSIIPPLPPPVINFNIDFNKCSNIEIYKEEYIKEALNSIYPFLVREANLNEFSNTLDFGCGLGRLAASFLINQSTAGSYFGYEPDQLAMNWLRKAYDKFENFKFDGKPLATGMNYVSNNTEKENSNEPKVGSVDPERIHSLIENNKLDLQCTCSVFTHMWLEDILNTLKIFNSFSSKSCVFINTWFIIDEFSIDSLNKKKADRELPIIVNQAYTYSKENPLLCTAYPIDKINITYRAAGQEIIKILYGSWSGRCNGVTYQDIIISKLN